MSRHSLRLILLSVFAFCISLASEACGINGYDFSELSSPNGVTISHSLGTFKLDPCGKMIGLGQFCVFTDTQESDKICGTIPNWAEIQDGVTLHLTDGENCAPRMGAPKSVYEAIITFKCSKTAGVGLPVADASLFPGSRCVDTKTLFYFIWETSFACSAAHPIGFGTVADILILIGIFAYLSGGYSYKRMKKGARGIEALPNIDFWKGLPRLMLDGFRFMIRCGKPGSYTTL